MEDNNITRSDKIGKVLYKTIYTMNATLGELILNIRNDLNSRDALFPTSQIFYDRYDRQLRNYILQHGNNVSMREIRRQQCVQKTRKVDC